MKKLAFFLSALAILAAFSARAGLAQEQHHRIVTRTRLQVLFSEYEEQWFKAVQQKDKATLEKIMGDDFHLWTPEPADPTPRAEWIEQATSRKLVSYQMRQLAARAASNDVAVISYVLHATYETGGKTEKDDSFVVDLWIRNGSGDTWVCTDRYQSKIADGGASAQPVKPSGKN